MPQDPNQLQMPINNQSAVNRATAVNNARMQSNIAMSSGQAMMAGPKVAQQAAAQGAEAQGQIAAQATQATVQEAGQAAQTELRQAVIQDQERAIITSESLERRATEQRSKLESLGRDIKQKLFDNTAVFEKNQGIVRLTEERQLQDFLTMKEVDKQTFLNYAEEVELAIQKEVAVMNAASNAIEFEMQRLFDLEQDAATAAQIKKLGEYKKRLKAREEKARGKASWTSKVVGAGKIVVAGAIVGGAAYVGGPAAAKAAAPTAAGLATSGVADIANS